MLKDSCACSSTPWTCRVLLVEDRPSQIALTRAVLEHGAFQVTEVQDGQQAVDIMRTDPHDVVLMDYHMPKLNGAEATRAIRRVEQVDSLTPSFIIGLTASAMPKEVALCLEAGMDRVMLKPINVTELVALVQGACVQTP